MRGGSKIGASGERGEGDGRQKGIKMSYVCVPTPQKQRKHDVLQAWNNKSKTSKENNI